jgi:hypothetical protein
MMSHPMPAAPEYKPAPRDAIVAAIRTTPAIRAAVLGLVGRDANTWQAYVAIADTLPSGCPFRVRDVIAACLDRDSIGLARLAVSL